MVPTLTQYGDCEMGLRGNNKQLDEDGIYYPEGGHDAWLVVLGASCGLAASLGIYNSIGVFEAVISKEILPNESSSTIGWLLSVYGFLVWLCGVQIGPTFDAMGPRALIFAGSVCTLVGVFCLSVCEEFYQIFLALSIITAIGTSLLITPSMGSVAHWFKRRRGLASGVAFMGSGIGGVIFPMALQSLLPQVGWGWSIRILGFVLLVLCCISFVFCRSRVPPTKGERTTWRDTIPDYRIFLDGTGAMAITTIGVVFVDLAYFIPITYIPSYYIDRQHLSTSDAALSGSAAFAYQLLAIINAASCGGRCVAGDLADRFGRYNTMAVSLALCAISVLGFWLPDMMVPNLSGDALLIVFAILFGFFSGSNVSITPICLGQLCGTAQYGRYYASCYTIVGFGVLASLPISGALLNVIPGTGKEKYWGIALFSGLSYLIALGSFVWVRVKLKGWNWSKW
uniref:ARAD1C10824p n=1 Tax=Blastobotrys adeninivorans TaxID=409370 RepID=A0A060T640_BLAAD